MDYSLGDTSVYHLLSFWVDYFFRVQVNISIKKHVIISKLKEYIWFDLRKFLPDYKSGADQWRLIGDGLDWWEYGVSVEQCGGK